MRTENGQEVYVSIANLIDEYITPALGDYAGDYDLEAIAAEITDEILELSEVTEAGYSLYSHRGYAINENIDFWEVVARHEI